MALKNRMENEKRTNRTLMSLLFGSLLVIGVMAWGLVKMSDVRRIYLPPSFRVGQVLEGNDVPDATVYAFAVTIWQQIHRWRDNGELNYPENINSLHNYLTPAFKAQLREDVQARITASNGAVNELRGRERSVSLPADFIYESKYVRQHDDGSWTVNILLDLTETYQGLDIKKIRILYPLVVKRYEVDWEKNAWGLALSGFAGDGPTRVDPEGEVVSMVHEK